MNQNQRNLNCFLIAIGISVLGFFAVNWFVTSITDGIFSIFKRNKPNASIRPILKEKITRISSEDYFLIKESINFKNQIEPSEIQKKNNEIKVFGDFGKLVFKDNYDKKCMACTVVHEMIGEVKTINKVLIETGYFRRVEYQLVDLELGKIDTFPSVPIFSNSCKYFVTYNFISKDSISGGINIYVPYNGHINRVAKREGQWIPTEMFWDGDEYIYAEVNDIKNSKIDLDNRRYLKISRKPFIRN